MSVPLNPGERNCPHCGAVVKPEARFCWLCGDALSAAATPDVVPAVLVPPPARFQFRLSSLLLIMTLVAVLLGTTLLAPGLGVAASVLLLPAFLRTLDVAAQKQFRGESLSFAEKAKVFATTILIVILVLVAVAIALAAICTAIVVPMLMFNGVH